MDTSEGKDTHRTDVFSDLLRSLDLLLVGGGGYQCFSQGLHGKFANSGANSQCFDPIGPEELVSEKGFDDGRYSGCDGRGLALVNIQFIWACIPRRLAPVVPAPPWWHAASMRLKSQS